MNNQTGVLGGMKVFSWLGRFLRYGNIVNCLYFVLIVATRLIRVLSLQPSPPVCSSPAVRLPSKVDERQD